MDAGLELNMYIFKEVSTFAFLVPINRLKLDNEIRFTRMTCLRRKQSKFKILIQIYMMPAMC